MGSRFLLLRGLKRSPLSRFLRPFSPIQTPPAPLPLRFGLLLPSFKSFDSFDPYSRSWASRSLSFGSVNLVLSDGKPRFETHEIEPPRKERYRTKKRLKLQRKREKRKRREANKKDPRRIRPKGKKQKGKFPTAEARIKYKIDKAKIKEAILIEKLKKYEVPKVQGPMTKPEELTGEECFYVKKMAQKKSNYVPVGRRGIFGGVILNMHMHWKKHETVKVVCKPCKPGQVHEYAQEIARLSGGIPIQIINNNTIVFYRGKNYVQPEVMSPIDSLSKKKALEKSKYEQSLETVRRFIAISEKELELYYRHVALYGDPNSRNADLVYGDIGQGRLKLETGISALTNEGSVCSASDDNLCKDLSNAEVDSGDTLEVDSSDAENDDIITAISFSEVDSDGILESDSHDENFTGAEVDSEGEEESETEADSEDEEKDSSCQDAHPEKSVHHNF
ncbi:putative CRM domain-containing protein, chloroplastic [Cocos nucifera]|nr:putative CRM domain-containing protein, chloroplastic [Cocos nucifera]